MNTLPSNNKSSQALSLPASSNQTSSVRGKNDSSLEHMKYIDKQLTATPKVLAEEKVTISEQAMALFRQDGTKNSDSKSAEEGINDKLLKQVKEQIESVKQQLSKIKNEQGESAVRQRRQLQLQIATLNASMLDLLGKKLDAI